MRQIAQIRQREGGELTSRKKSLLFPGAETLSHEAKPGSFTSSRQPICGLATLAFWLY